MEYQIVIITTLSQGGEVLYGFRTLVDIELDMDFT
jgi:hypothetical protein